MNELSPTGQANLDRLVTLLQVRLSSAAKAATSFPDKDGNVKYVDIDIYGRETLIAFLYLSLSEFNQTPYFSFFTFEDTKLIELVTDLLVEGATLSALASKALTEKGREFKMIDNGLAFDPPPVSDLLQSQWATLLGHHWQKLQVVKGNILDFIKHS
jgi:hypothetical protein